MSEEKDKRTLVEAAQRDPPAAELYEQNFYRVYAYIVRKSATVIRPRI
jgi:hypothetical protein